MCLQLLNLESREMLLIIILQVEFLIIYALQHRKRHLSVALHLIFLRGAVTSNGLIDSDRNEINEELDGCVVHRLASLLADHVHSLCHLILIDMIIISEFSLSKNLPQILASPVGVGLNCL
jgi:hypothetical protein